MPAFGLAQVSPDLPLDALLGPYGLLVFLILVVVLGGVKKWWVFGWLYQEKVVEIKAAADRADRWERAALRAAGVNEDALVTTRKVVEHADAEAVAAEAVRKTLDELQRRGDL